MKRISKEETQSLLKSSLDRKRDDLKMANYDSSEYYLLTDGRILIDLKDGAQHSLLMDHEQEYREFFDRVSNSQPEHILKGFPATGVGFVEVMMESPKRLEDILRINSLDFTYESLKKIDEVFKTRRVNYDLFSNQLFYWLVFYVTQTVAREERAELEFVSNPEHNIAEPFIRLRDGRLIQIFVDLFENAAEDFGSFSVFGSSQLRLHAL